ncbi:MAG: ArsC/Spx/MgsR family protein [Sphaerobacter sp.]|nr:ArsC/Spx/MgsR family protein [Sphaerobacter sp.]
MLRRAGLTPREALSTRSRAYRELGLAERTVSDDELLDLMVAEPTLLRRPLVLTPGGSVLGFDRKRLDALLGGTSS